MILKRSIIAAIALSGTATPAVSQTYLDQLINKITKKKGTTGASASAATGGRFSTPIDPAQTATIDKLLAQPLQDPAVTADRAEAAPLIRILLATGTCALQSEAWNMTNRYRLTPQSFSGYLPWLTPNANTKYHDQTKCLDVQRIADWSKPAKNALRFRAWYVAADSGEAGNQRFELQKASDGTWVIRDVSWGEF